MLYTRKKTSQITFSTPTSSPKSFIIRCGSEMGFSHKISLLSRFLLPLKSYFAHSSSAIFWPKKEEDIIGEVEEKIENIWVRFFFSSCEVLIEGLLSCDCLKGVRAKNRFGYQMCGPAKFLPFSSISNVLLTIISTLLNTSWLFFKLSNLKKCLYKYKN